MPVLIALLAASACTAGDPIRVERIDESGSQGPVRGFVATVDVADARVVPLVTGRLDSPDCPDGADARLVPTDEWADRSGAAVAVNANYFGKVRESAGRADFADIIGLCISDGQIVSSPRVVGDQPDPALVITADHRAMVAHAGAGQIEHVLAAVAGVGPSETDPDRGSLLVERGINLGRTARVDPEARHPRTSAGVSRDGRTLVLMVIDGRQPEWSVGVTLPELADMMIAKGVYDAVNLDGGGSSAFFFRAMPNEQPVTNRPSDGHFRPVASNIGFRLRGVPAASAISTASHPEFCLRQPRTVARNVSWFLE